MIAEMREEDIRRRLQGEYDELARVLDRLRGVKESAFDDQRQAIAVVMAEILNAMYGLSELIDD